MNLYRLLIAPLLLWAACLQPAHAEEAYMTLYNAAKQQYHAKKYDIAMQQLTPLMNEEMDHEMVPYAYFYYALAAYHKGDKDTAEHTFNTIQELFPDWEALNEVLYWRGQLYLEKDSHHQGIELLNTITDKHLQKPIKKLKTHFLSKIVHIDTLQELLKQHPHDATIAQELFERLAQQSIITRDHYLLDTLARDFNLAIKEKSLLSNLRSIKKDTYQIGILLPFFIHKQAQSSKSSNSFVMSLYQGIKIATEDLKKQGINITLHVYDTKRDPATTATILKQKEIQQLDLIIGPLYPETTPLVTAFAQEHRINLFNPLSENPNVVGNNPFIFLFRPSLATQAKKAAEFTLQDAQDNTQVGIIYSTTKEGPMQAHLYKQYVERGLGKPVKMMIPIAPHEAPGFLHQLRERIEKTNDQPEEIDDTELPQEEPWEETLASLTHIYVVSTDELIAANALSAIEMLNLKPCIIGHEKWLQYSSVLEQMQRLRAHFIAPDFIDYEKKGIHKFRKQFYTQYRQYPDISACKGYELMHFLGHQLHQHGTYFQKYWTQTTSPGVILNNIRYDGHNDNQEVPMMQVKKNGNLVVIH